MTAPKVADPLRALRREFPIARGTTFLNHASFGPVPVRGRRLVDALLKKQSIIREDPDVDGETFSLLEKSRRLFARLAGAPASRVAFCPNASYGLNAILGGLLLKPGERVLVPVNEFPAAVYAVRTLAERGGLTVVPILCPDGAPDLSVLEAELKRGAAVLVTSWVQYFNGYRNDLAQLARLCHAHGCFLLVDVTQGAGVTPLRMTADGVDAIACGTQKWLLGQTGGGFFAIASAPIRSVRPPYGGWLGYDWGYTWGDLQRWDRPAFNDGRFWEVGTYPFYSVRLAYAGLSILAECGVGRIHRHIQSLHRRLGERLVGTPWRPLVFPRAANRSAIVSIAGPQTKDLHRRLTAQRIYVSLREGNIRVSPHFYNTAADVDRLATAMIRFAAHRGRKQS
ncbi:MAG TPA: aminotransferase class V-fold PLP-dependent enzyme [bacterium]|nr:aminotransferase class V-fold PLP-dependent enzyme [bacterium]